MNKKIALLKKITMLLVKLNTYTVKQQKKALSALDKNLLKLGLTPQLIPVVKKDSRQKKSPKQ